MARNPLNSHTIGVTLLTGLGVLFTFHDVLRVLPDFHHTVVLTGQSALTLLIVQDTILALGFLTAFTALAWVAPQRGWTGRQLWGSSTFLFLLMAGIGVLWEALRTARAPWSLELAQEFVQFYLQNHALTYLAAWEEMVSGFTFLIYTALWVAALLWVYRDAERRGRVGCFVTLMVMFFFPLGLLLWLILRPPLTPEES